MLELAEPSDIVQTQRRDRRSLRARIRDAVDRSALGFADGLPNSKPRDHSSLLPPPKE